MSSDYSENECLLLPWVGIGGVLRSLLPVRSVWSQAAFVAAGKSVPTSTASSFLNEATSNLPSFPKETNLPRVPMSRATGLLWQVQPQSLDALELNLLKTLVNSHSILRDVGWNSKDHSFQVLSASPQGTPWVCDTCKGVTSCPLPPPSKR